MILDRTHSVWAISTGVLSLIAAVLYWIYASTVPGGPGGGTWQGMLFGVSGTICMIYAGLLAGRKKVPKWRIGSALTWTKGHVWMGLLSVPLILFHCRFRWSGTLEQFLMLTYAVVIVSGFYGLALQQVLPRLMSTASPAQAIAPQIGVACKKLKEDTERRVQEVCGSKFLVPLASKSTPDEYSAERELASFYWEHVSSFLSNEVNPLHPLANSTIAAARFSRLKDGVAEGSLREVVERLQLACDERRQLMAQSRIQSWLHGWLCIHVPVSVSLLVLGLIHVLMSIYY